MQNHIFYQILTTLVCLVCLAAAAPMNAESIGSLSHLSVEEFASAQLINSKLEAARMRSNVKPLSQQQLNSIAKSTYADQKKARKTLSDEQIRKLAIGALNSDVGGLDLRLASQPFSNVQESYLEAFSKMSMQDRNLLRQIDRDTLTKTPQEAIDFYIKQEKLSSEPVKKALEYYIASAKLDVIREALPKSFAQIEKDYMRTLDRLSVEEDELLRGIALDMDKKTVAQAIMSMAKKAETSSPNVKAALEYFESEGLLSLVNKQLPKSFVDISKDYQTSLYSMTNSEKMQVRAIDRDLQGKSSAEALVYLKEQSGIRYGNRIKSILAYRDAEIRLNSIRKDLGVKSLGTGE